MSSPLSNMFLRGIDFSPCGWNKIWSWIFVQMNSFQSTSTLKIIIIKKRITDNKFDSWVFGLIEHFEELRKENKGTQIID